MVSVTVSGVTRVGEVLLSFEKRVDGGVAMARRGIV